MSVKTVYIRRIQNTSPILFELLGHKTGLRIVADYPMLLILQKSGVEIKDIDAIRLEQSKWN